MVRDGRTSLESEQGEFEETRSHVDPYGYLVTSLLIRHQLHSALPRAAIIDYARESLSSNARGEGEKGALMTEKPQLQLCQSATLPFSVVLEIEIEIVHFVFRTDDNSAASGTSCHV